MRDISDLIPKQASRELHERIDRIDFSGLVDRIPRQTLRESGVVRELEQRAEGRGFVGGFLIGALVGALLALVFAPRRGADTRDFLVHKAVDVKEMAAKRIEHAEERVEAVSDPDGETTGDALKQDEASSESPASTAD